MLLVIAILSTVLLWVCNSLSSEARIRDNLTLSVAAVCIPVVVAAIFYLWNVVAERVNCKFFTPRLLSVSDQALYSKNGNLLGIQLSYSIKFPWIAGDVDAANGPGTMLTLWERSAHIDTTMFTRIIEPPLAFRGTYCRGVRYNFVEDRVPLFVKMKTVDRMPCLEGFDPRWHSFPKKSWAIYISGCNFRGKTQGLYSPEMFYQGAVKDGAKPCGVQ